VKPRTIRRLVLLVFVSGIAGMIVGSILDNNGVAITFGLVTAMAAVGLILVTAVAPPGAFRGNGGATDDDPTSVPDEGADAAGMAIEEQVELLVGRGADEQELRELIRRSIAYGRRASR